MHKAAVCSFFAGLAIGASAFAADYPSKPVRLIVPFPVGGTTDVLGRLVAAKLSSGLGQPVVVENIGGASGSIGTAAIARAAGDGYTFGMSSVSTHGTNPHLLANLSYDPVKDFAPITKMVDVPNILEVHPSFPARDWKEFLATVKANPGKYNYGSAGNGSVSHISIEFLKLLTRIEIVHIPYKGSGPALNGVLAGEALILFDNLPTSVPHIRSGKLRPIGLAFTTRLPAVQEVPTFAELGLKEYEAASWFGFVAPASTPKVIVARLNAEIAKVLLQPDTKARLEDLGAIPVGNSPEAFGGQIRAEIAKWAPVVKASGAKID